MCLRSHLSRNSFRRPIVEALGPGLGPPGKWKQQCQQFVALRCQGIAVRRNIDDRGLSQLSQAFVQKPWIGFCRRLKVAECERLRSKLPQNTERGSAPEQVEERHDRAARRRAPNGKAKCGCRHAIFSIAKDAGVCYILYSIGAARVPKNRIRRAANTRPSHRGSLAA